MKVAIAGAGITGAYLYRRLRETQDVHIYDLKQATGCGIAPCAWGTSKEFEYYVTKAGFDAGRFMQNVAPSVSLNGVTINVDLVTFDKPKFIQALLDGAGVNTGSLQREKYDRVIDATGGWRAFLPTVQRDLHVPGIQYLVQSERPLETRISFVKIGYAWCFSLSGGRYHIGCACLNANPRAQLENLGWLSDGADMEVICNCGGRVRVASVQASQPFVVNTGERDVWGVGEAIGCVSPLVGEGIVPGLRSVEILLEYWDDSNAYTKAILDEFGWMKEEREVVDRLVSGKRLGIRDAWIIKQNSQRMGIKVGLKVALILMRKLGEQI